MARNVSISRKTSETDVSVSLKVDGVGISNIKTGIGFFDHMLNQFAYHSQIDMHVQANGDLYIDDHHTVEDCGILLGRALFEALGKRCGITRYASLNLVMDESHTLAAIDISDRPFLVWKVAFNASKIGTFDTELIRDFFQAFVQNSGITLHVINHYGTNNHHIAESCFKVVARVLGTALKINPERGDVIPSTKGSLKG